MERKWYTQLLILLGTLFVIGASLAALRYLRPMQMPSTPQPTPTSTPSPTPEPLTYTNLDYSYELTYAGNYSYEETGPASINFRKKDDTNPSVSGVTINVEETIDDFLEYCTTHDHDTAKYYCDEDTTPTSLATVNTTWDTYPNNSANALPSGYVYATTSKNSVTYVVVNHGYDKAEVENFLYNFSFLQSPDTN